MQFQKGDNVRLKPEAASKSALGFELKSTDMLIVNFESETVAVCAWLRRGKTQTRRIPVDQLERATS